MADHDLQRPGSPINLLLVILVPYVALALIAVGVVWFVRRARLPTATPLD